ncbi:GGDEF domain-containing protein [Marinicella litoralis]|uniref:diguanylate cyclase n=1 Tax=Marinicella litoralis TaxID=644220 RepID=A0A4R6XG97_9GAMM|nr:GGDEF domain-containing protein [Marinicella litoralis]TDR16830.1 diguanylate cyclase (GGDEF)-like protein [Marinicella litoralis]
MNIVPQTNQRQPIKQSILLKYMHYFSLYIVISVAMFYTISAYYKPLKHIDWSLVSIYSILAFMSYHFFVINDLNARKMNGRAMAIGFFLAYIGISIVASSFVFVIPDQRAWFVAGLLLFTGYLLSGIGLLKWAKYHKQVKKVMLHESLTDELTGLFNRRAFAVNANRELAFSVQSESDFSVMMIDIDDFKLINDRYGHTIGDEILVQISQIFDKYKGDSDSLYRWGGEEFVVLMPVTGLFEANKVANKIVSKVAENTFIADQSLKLNLTVSIGVAQWVRGESIVKNTLDRADKALYKAKATGKNAVVVADYKEDSHKPPIAEGASRQVSINQ